MKRCTQCGREYDDSKQFCSGCGGRLAPVPVDPPPNPKTGGGSGAKSGSGSSFEQWGGISIALLGLILEWGINAALGLAVVIGGSIYSIYKSKSRTNIVISAMICVIGLALFLLFMPI